MIDLESVKSQADLLAIASRDTTLRKVAASGGGEYAGPCPFCGGRDRFRVQPGAGRWLCRQCTGGKWRDVIAYIAQRDNLDAGQAAGLAEICKRITGGDLPSRPAGQLAPPPVPAYGPPAADWQQAAQTALAECQAALWDPKYHKALDYLRQRGLTDASIKRFGLGYCATGKSGQYGREIAGLYIPRGIVIPCLAAGEIWYLKIRLLPGVPVKCQACQAVLPGPGRCSCGADNRYRGIKGNRPAAIYNADSLAGADLALFCEGEFDAMLASQHLGDVLACVTLGSATNRPDLASWGHYLIGLRVILAAYDADNAGSAGAAALAGLSPRITRIDPPEGAKDLAEFAQGGGDLWTWLKPILAEIDPPGLTGAALLDQAEAASNRGDISTFARLWAAGMIATEGERDKWQSWAADYGITPAAIDSALERCSCA